MVQVIPTSATPTVERKMSKTQKTQTSDGTLTYHSYAV